MWSVQVPDGLRGTNSVAHTNRYFDFERRQQRPKEARWKNFIEATQTLDGVQYSIMSFDVNWKQGESSGLFLLYFPTDFDLTSDKSSTASCIARFIRLARKLPR